MALDIYVGSLTRYYTGDWENVAERSARARGAAPQVGRQRDAEGVRPAVLAWRDALAASLGSNVATGLDWDESTEAPHFTGRPGWDGFGSLVLWAAYAEHPALRRPDSLPDEWDDDPALLRCNAQGSRYSHLTPTSCAMSSCGCPVSSTSLSRARMSTAAASWSARRSRCRASSSN